MKRTLKTVIVSILLLALTACALLVFAACNEKNTGGKNTGEDKGNFISDYASAKTAWDTAPNKMSVDSGSITATLGTGEKPVEVTAKLEGKRVYIGDTFRMEYTVTIFGLADVMSAASDDQTSQDIADALIDAISDDLSDVDDDFSFGDLFGDEENEDESKASDSSDDASASDLFGDEDDE